jgi:hypothetical protein
VLVLVLVLVLGLGQVLGYRVELQASAEQTALYDRDEFF